MRPTADVVEKVARAIFAAKYGIGLEHFAANPAPHMHQARAALAACGYHDMVAALEAFVGMQSTDDVNAIIEQCENALAKARGETSSAASEAETR